jgi:hypothetical protein
MRFRKLRIVWSVVCAIACVLLVVLWVRSQYNWDSANGPLLGKELIVTSRNGGVAVGLSNRSISKWHVRHLKEPTSPREGYSYALGFGVNAAIPAIFVPHWFTILLSAFLAIAPWLRWRFSLRTLLIATTIIAVVLGLIVWSTW